MTVDFRSQANARDTDTNITCPRPTGCDDDDILLMFVIAAEGTSGIDSKTGSWTALPEAFVSDGSTVLWVIPFWRRISDIGSEPSSYTVNLVGPWVNGTTVLIAAFSGVDPTVSDPIRGTNIETSQGQTFLGAEYTTGEGGDEAVFVGAVKGAVGIESITGWRAKQEMSPTYGSWLLATRSMESGANDSFLATHTGGSLPTIGYTIVLGPTPNVAPLAPTLLTPYEGETVALEQAQRFSWTVNDELWDSQLAYDLRYRVVGASSWTTLATVTTPGTEHIMAGSTFTANDYEWQVRTYDQHGDVSPWSSSGHFTAASPPSGPSISAPANNATVEATTTVSWTVADQDKYQVRRVADSNGAPDTATVYYDSGAVTNTTARSLAVNFDVDGRFEHVQVRIEDATLWSAWASVRVDVSYTAPPVPTFTLTPNAATGSIEVNVTNPTPVGDEPTVTHNSVWVDDGDGLGFVRRGTSVSYNGSWTYWTPVSGRTYDTSNVYVVAHGDNGGTSQSA